MIELSNFFPFIFLGPRDNGRYFTSAKTYVLELYVTESITGSKDNFKREGIYDQSFPADLQTSIN